MEYCETEALVFDNGKLKTGTFDTRNGFGLRAIQGEASAYSHSGDMSEGALKRAADVVKAIQSGTGGSYSEAPPRTNHKLYVEENPIGSPDFATKVALLQDMDAYARNLNCLRVEAGRSPF